MAEEQKKPRRPVDPNSAKYKLGQIAAKAYSDAAEAKERGELVGWCSSNFPVEIPETLGLYVVYPENQAAAIAARGHGEEMCQISEEDGYSNDLRLCAYQSCLCKSKRFQRWSGNATAGFPFMLQ